MKTKQIASVLLIVLITIVMVVGHKLLIYNIDQSYAALAAQQVVSDVAYTAMKTSENVKLFTHLIFALVYVVLVLLLGRVIKNNQ